MNGGPLLPTSTIVVSPIDIVSRGVEIPEASSSAKASDRAILVL